MLNEDMGFLIKLLIVNLSSQSKALFSQGQLKTCWLSTSRIQRGVLLAVAFGISVSGNLLSTC